ncbi:MAG: hypothetical protein H6R10_250 [Rhodocyclaceae bacterium]|nr:hypothetical protein [Rhodocyclaceae bacterium]
MRSPQDNPTDLSQVHLVMFMTAGMSLAEWDRLGMLDREVEIYRRLAAHCASVSIVTYGGSADARLSRRFPEIRVVCNRWRLPRPFYETYLTRWALRSVRGQLVVKTNQSHGGDLARRVATRLDGRFVARCGYLISFVGEQKFGPGSPRSQEETKAERRLFTAADQVVVTTEAMRQRVLGYGIRSERVRVIPNYVVLDWFTPPERYEGQAGCLAFVGRLSEEKNLEALIRAVAELGMDIVLVGDGPDRIKLEALARELGCRALFLGRRPYREIPGILASCHLFALTSLYEGHPKALIEGMAAGLPVIGTDVPGIREAIEHGQTGWLAAGTDAAALKAAIARVAGDPNLRRRLGTAARRQVEATLSIERILLLELEMLSAAAAGVPGMRTP